MNLKKYFLTLFALCLMGTISAQTLTQAKKMFDNAQYEKARDAFSKLI